MNLAVPFDIFYYLKTFRFY